MNRRQFVALFVCSLIPWWIGSGLMPLLPLYAARLGASPTVAGNYLALIFLALAAGTAAGGSLSRKGGRYSEQLILTAVIGAAATWLLGNVTALWQLIALSATVWFAFGITLALVAVVAGLSSAQEQRGRVYGLLAVTSALGGVLGGPTGFVADRWGYPLLFALMGNAWLLQIIAALLLQNPQAKPSQPAVPKAAQADGRPMRTVPAYLLLLGAALLFSTGGFAGTLGRSLAMEAQGYANTTITLMAALVSAFGLILHPLLGYLSDRGDRRLFLSLVYLAGGLALVVLAWSRTPLHYAIVALLTAVGGAERGISSALVSDLLPADALGRGMSLFDSVKWIGGVVGLAGTGAVIQHLGLSSALLVSGALPLLALTLVFFVQRSGATPGPVAIRQVNARRAVEAMDSSL